MAVAQELSLFAGPRVFCRSSVGFTVGQPVQHTSHDVASSLFNSSFGLRFTDWNIEWKPAPYPCTEAQREAAAKRYGLILSDYKPFEDDGLAPGDYPNLQPFNEANKDPWEHYDFYPVKRNYNEPVPFWYEFYSEAGTDPEMEHTLFFDQPLWRIILKSLALPISVFFIIWAGSYFPIYPPEKAKQYPFYGDQEHYTFEPAE